ncbi:hypothetical protein D0Y65_010919 [Glycine soja]|uniref:RanBP2-type domain-containing protein n=1 Tax=Glycine soja TaxID=3848 RepID=A0A445KHJ1_GLYSO|nr:hypothetical protein D0Y65_010919 [Glycine soja]
MSWSGGDWMCGVCEHINFKKREACQSCGYPKYGGPDPSTYRYNRTEALPGDWFCNCGAHNYANRSSCYRCGSMKDDYSSGYGNNSGGYGSDTFPPGWKTGDWLCPSSMKSLHLIMSTNTNYISPICPTSPSKNGVNLTLDDWCNCLYVFYDDMDVECIIMLAGQNAINAKCQGIMVVLTETRNFTRPAISLISPLASFFSLQHSLLLFLCQVLDKSWMKASVRIIALFFH